MINIIKFDIKGPLDQSCLTPLLFVMNKFGLTSLTPSEKTEGVRLNLESLQNL